jgi:DtxR family Mn-dependent transcriptional regulator
MTVSIAEENYLKEIFTLSRGVAGKIPNLQIAQNLGLNPPTVTEMLRKLADKGLIDYSRSGGATLTSDGEVLALHVIRKHRLWETFLVNTLGFTWDEVHEVAEQLEHIRSEKLLDQLDKFLGFPEFDPHGDPIPNSIGILPVNNAIPLSACRKGEFRRFVAVSDHSQAFLQYVDKQELKIKETLEVLEISEFDGSMNIQLKNSKKVQLSAAVCGNILVV